MATTTDAKGKVVDVNDKVVDDDAKATITEVECFKNFRDFLDFEKNGLKLFYKDDDSIKKLTSHAKTMIEKLFDLGCKKEIALQLSILILYDMVMLIDDSTSMQTEQEGGRIKTLKKAMQGITSVYDLANPNGIRAVKFINAKQGIRNYKNKSWKKNFGTRRYDGMTRIGTALKAKILDQLVWKDPMTKPLLVMIITDGDAEGERHGLLEDVLRDCVARLDKDVERGKQAVAFHFSRVGNDKPAQALLEKLDDSEAIGDNVDCLSASGSLEKLSDPEDRYKWVVLPKLLLGAIMERWDEIDNEEEVDAQTDADGARLNEEEEDVEGGEDGSGTDDDD